MNLKQRLLSGAELALAVLPRRAPAPEHWHDARIVAHRGDTRGGRAPENTFAAFDPLHDNGIWGVEFDIRWTADLEPVVLHDPDLRRVFGIPLRVDELSFAALRRRCPQVPHLGEVVDRYADALHLMIELKPDRGTDPDVRRRRLLAQLQGLTPAEDYHILALETRLFDRVADVPPHAWLPVARMNVARMSTFALRTGCAGMAGPAPLLWQRYLRRHRAAGQAVGVGFPFTRGLCERELLRGVDWLFSDHALRLASWRARGTRNQP